tara:strand:- start:5554 stop:6159 length:606 start_codon:yes stop_codon:yes gene_type:complete
MASFGIFGSKKKQKTTGSKEGSETTDIRTGDAPYYDEDVAALRSVLGMARLAGGRMRTDPRLQKASFVENIDTDTNNTEEKPRFDIGDLFGVDNPYIRELMEGLSPNFNPSVYNYGSAPFAMQGASGIANLARESQALDPNNRLTSAEQGNIGLSQNNPVDLDGIDRGSAESFLDQLPEGTFFRYKGQIRRKTNNASTQST